MMASILPYDDTMTALGSSDTIVLDWTIAAFDATIITQEKPTQPTAAVDPDAAIGAAYTSLAYAVSAASLVYTLL